MQGFIRPKALNFWSSERHYACILAKLKRQKSTSLKSLLLYTIALILKICTKVSFSHFMHKTSKLTVYPIYQYWICLSGSYVTYDSAHNNVFLFPLLTSVNPGRINRKNHSNILFIDVLGEPIRSR